MTSVVKLRSREPAMVTPTLEKVHPLAAHLPLMEGEEFAGFVADIKEKGLFEAVDILPDGTLIDGRNRVSACNQLGMEIPCRVYQGDQDDVSILQFIVSKNLHRRHLTPAQAADLARTVKHIYAAEAKKRQLTSLKQGDAPRSGPPAGTGVEARDEAAATVPGTSGRSVQRAQVIREKGIPELQDAVFGAEEKISLTKGAEIAKAPKEEQPELVRKAIEKPAAGSKGKGGGSSGAKASPAPEKETSASGGGKRTDRYGYTRRETGSSKDKPSGAQTVSEAIRDLGVTLEPRLVTTVCKQLSEGKLTEQELKMLKGHVRTAYRKLAALYDAIQEPGAPEATGQTPREATQRLIAALKGQPKETRVEEVRTIMEALGVGTSHLADTSLSIKL